MRCKNCGAENDDNRYICEICGSPLYDDEDMDTNQEDTNSYVEEPMPPSNGRNGNNSPNNNDDKTKKSIIIIAALCVLLVAIIVGIVVAAHSKNADKTTTESTSLTTVAVEESDLSTEKKTEKTTESTTKETTTKVTTTKPTTTTTTKPSAKIYHVYVDKSGNGSVSGNGSYEEGDVATLTASPAEGYTFDGWYENGNIVEAGTTYSFEVTNDATITAQFSALSDPAAQ